MQLPNPFRKFLSSSIPTNSTGVIRRNYHKPATFNPHRQLTGITYKAIDKIGQTVSVYRPQVTRRSGEMLENHPLYNLFDKPNPRVNMGNDFIHLWAMLMEIYGESFWYFAKGETTKRVKEIYLLNPAQIELKVDNGELIGYVLHKQNGQHVPLEVDEVLHDKRPNPFNEWRGLSVLEKAAVYVDTEINTSTFTLNYIANSASPSGIVTLPQMTPEAFRQFTHQWREGYEGPENAGKTAFIRGGEANFQAVGATLKDIDQKVTRDMAKEDVLMMLDMPRAMLGMTDDKGLGRASVETMKYIYAESKLQPLMERLDSIYQQILPMISSAEGYTVTHESPIPEDKEYMHTVHKDLVNVAITVNEVRENLGLPPLPDGDVLASNRPPVEQPTKSVKVAMKKKISKAEQLKQKQIDQEKFRKELVATSDVYATKIKSEISKLASKQESAIIDKLSASTKAYEEWLFNVKDESIAMAAVIVPIIIELMEEQAGAVQHWLTGELLTISPELRKTVEANITKIAGVFNEETLKALEKTISQGVTDGESLVKLKKRVETVYSDAKGYRAERIARTEGLKASNLAAEYSYKNAGYSTVEWFVNPGACEFCLSLSGRTKEIGGQFLKQGEILVGTDGNQLKIDYDDVGSPPAHPNCTCSLVPGVE